MQGEETSEAVSRRIIERSKYIPVRLSLSDRKMLRLLEAALNVSEYTDKVDVLGFIGGSKKSVRITKQVRFFFSDPSSRG